MSNRYTLLFPIETTVRELQSKLLLASTFADRGFACFIGSKAEIEKVLTYTEPVIYFDKGYHENVTEKIHEKVKQSNGLMISLDEENGVDYKDYHNLLKRFPEKAFDLYDLFFLWGKKQAELLKKKRLNYKDKKIVISGHPKYDLLKPKYNTLYNHIVDNLRKKYGKFILFNMCIKYYNNIRSREEVVANYRGRAKKVDERFEYEKIKLKKTIQLIHKLSETTDMNIVIRPHPEEDINCYLNEFRTPKNIHVIYDKSVIYWILAAHIVIHNDSSTGVESAMVGKKVISYLPYFNEDLSPWLPVELSQRFNNAEDVLEFIKNGSGKHETDNMAGTDKTDGLLADYFSYDLMSTDIVVENILRLTQNKIPGPGKNRSIFFLPFENSKFKAKNAIKNNFSKIFDKNSARRLLKNKLKGLDKQNVTDEFDALNRILKSNIKIKYLNHYLYKISR